MCVGGPSASDMPTVPERQAARAPEKSATGGTDPNVARRRMAFASSILTSAQGVTGGGPATTAGMKSVTGV